MSTCIKKLKSNRFVFLLATLLLLATTAVLSPNQVPLVLYKLNLVTLAAVLGYWIDILLFPAMRPVVDDPYPSNVHPNVLAAIVIRRSLIIFGSILGISMGL